MTDLLIKKLDSNVPQSPGRWLRGEIVANQDTPITWGSGELNLGIFLRYTVTDNTAAQLSTYMDVWNRDLVIVNTTIPNGAGLRSISITNSLVNASGDMGEWTPAVTTDILTRWNDNNLSLTLTNDGIVSASVWNATVILPTEQDEIAFDQFIDDYGKGALLKRRIWYVTEAGMQSIESAGGTQSGTAAQLSSIMRDGLLD